MAGRFQEEVRPPDSRFSAPVPRELVHRKAISEVFLTGLRSVGHDMYTVWAQWPRWHVFYASGGDRFDSALVIETLRQLTVLIAHTQLGVPLDMQFLMPDMSVSMSSGATRNPLHPAEVTVEVLVSGVRKTGPRVAAFRTTAVFLVDGHRIAEGTAGARIVDPGAYSRIRSRSRVASRHHEVLAVSAEKVGHSSVWNVVLGESHAAGCWPLRVDVSNPILFDHPLDHVPGVLLIEAVRQALRLVVPDRALDFATLEAQFTSIVELGDDAEVILQSLSGGPESMTAMATVQVHGKVLMRAVAGVTRANQPLPGRERGLQPTPAPTGTEDPRGNLHA